MLTVVEMRPTCAVEVPGCPHHTSRRTFFRLRPEMDAERSIGWTDSLSIESAAAARLFDSGRMVVTIEPIRSSSATAEMLRRHSVPIACQTAEHNIGTPPRWF